MHHSSLFFVTIACCTLHANSAAAQIYEVRNVCDLADKEDYVPSDEEQDAVKLGLLIDGQTRPIIQNGKYDDNASNQQVFEFYYDTEVQILLPDEAARARLRAQQLENGNTVETLIDEEAENAAGGPQYRFVQIIEMGTTTPSNFEADNSLSTIQLIELTNTATESVMFDITIEAEATSQGVFSEDVTFEQGGTALVTTFDPRGGSAISPRNFWRATFNQQQDLSIPFGSLLQPAIDYLSTPGAFTLTATNGSVAKQVTIEPAETRFIYVSLNAFVNVDNHSTTLPAQIDAITPGFGFEYRLRIDELAVEAQILDTPVFTDLVRPYDISDFIDIIAYLDAVEAEDPAADVNADGTIDADDVMLFMADLQIVQSRQ